MNSRVPAGETLPSGEGRATEWLLRAFALLAYGLTVGRLATAWWADPSRWTLLLLLVTEGYTLLLVLLARRASARDLSLVAMVTSVYAAYFFVLFDPDGTRRWVPELAGVGLQLAGMAWQLTSKIALGRSFGLLPAQRKLVLAGPYRVVRHPIYLGYLISHIGFLLVNASWRNFAVLAVLYVCQVIRIRREESMLAADPAYVDYQQQVRWRLVPGLY